MEAILLGLQVVIGLVMIGIVLIQRSDQDGFGMGSGSGSNFMTGRQSANFLTRATTWLGGAFMLNCLVLTVLAASHSEVSIVDRIEAAQKINPDMPAVAPEASVEEAAKDAFGDIPAAPTADDAENATSAPAAPAAEEPAQMPKAPVAE